VHLVFTTRAGDDLDLWWVNVDGTELRNLTADPAICQSLVGAN